MMGDVALALIGLGTVGAVYLTGWGIFALGATAIRVFRKAVWTRALYIASERPDTLATVIPMLVQLGVLVDAKALDAQMPRKVRKFIDGGPEPTEVEIVVTDTIETIPDDVALDFTPTETNDLYISAAQDAWGRVRELEDLLLLAEADRDYKDDLRAQYLRRIRRIEQALADPDADLYAAVHPFLARDVTVTGWVGRIRSRT